MPDYRLLFFRGGALDHWEMIEATDHLAALEEAGARPSEGLMELWSDERKVASFKPVGTQGSAHSTLFAQELRRAPEPDRPHTDSSDAPGRSSTPARGRE
jgi:hypothetical protein